MKSVSAGVRVSILFLLLAVGGYFVWKNLGEDPAGENNYSLYVDFADAFGLPAGSKVVVAGLPKGEVTSLKVKGRFARVTFKIDDEIVVYSSGNVAKRATSLLGDNYLSLDPGVPERQGPDGTTTTYIQLGPKCPDYNAKDEAKRDKCRRVPTPIEAITPDQIMVKVEGLLKNVDGVLASVRDLSEDVRRIINGPLNSVASRVDGLVQREAGTISNIIAKADKITANVEKLTNELGKITNNADPKINALLDNLNQTSAEAKDLVTSAKRELEQTGTALRDKLDKLDGVISNTESITNKINEPKGTIGVLVNDPTIAENVEEITNDAKGFLGTLFGLKAYVGMRSEYNVFAGLLRHYITVELHTRPDKYYLIELEKGPRGDYPDVTLTFDPTVDPNNWVRKTVIEDKIRFTFQFAKRFSWLTLRYGLKESTGGVGADADVPVWFNRRLRLSADVFDATFDRFPRVKIAAALEMWRHLYIIAGVDELLNCGSQATFDSLRCDTATLPIVQGNSGVPIQFDEFYYGRDVFLGAMLRFNDEDLAALLTVGGSALSGAAQ